MKKEKTNGTGAARFAPGKRRNLPAMQREECFARSRLLSTVGVDFWGKKRRKGGGLPIKGF